MSEFARYSFQCNTYARGIDNEIIIEDGIFYPQTMSPIMPVNDATKEEIDTVEKLVKSHLRRIVDPDNFEEESSWLLNRYAILLQNPTAKIDNIMVMQGSQGSGKTTLIEMLMLLFPRGDTALMNDAEDIERQFIPFERITHVDDIDPNLNKKAINHLKAISTSSQKAKEKKYQDRTVTPGTINISISTNEDITNMEVLSGRRFTCLINNEAHLRENVDKQVHDLFTKLKNDDWRLFRVLHTYMLERDTKNFKSDYKTKAQKQAILENSKGSDITIAIANMIANYGYITPELQIIVPNTICNRSDFYIALMNHYLYLDKEPESIQKPEDLRIQKNSKIYHKFKNKRLKSVFDDLFHDVQKRQKSSINSFINSTWTWEIPSIQKWIELLTVAYMDSRSSDMIEHIIEVFGFEDQWNWDNTTKPDIENLGNINIYDTADILNLNDSEDF